MLPRPTRRGVNHGRQPADPHRTRQHGRDRGAGGPLLGRADAALAAEFPHRRRAHAAAADPRARRCRSKRRRAPTWRWARSTARSARRSSRPPTRSIDGKLDDDFPLVVWQTGSGTQTNMNVNEVHRQPRHRDPRRPASAARQPVHPNDHVNLGQSSNDSFPTAMHIAAAVEIDCRLLPALRALHDALARQGEGIRRHRQDRPHASAGCDAADARPGVRRLCDARSSSASRASRRRCRGSTPLAQGGTAVGTGLNAKKGFAERFAAELAADHRPRLSSPRAEQVRGAGRA